MHWNLQTGGHHQDLWRPPASHEPSSSIDREVVFYQPRRGRGEACEPQVIQQAQCLLNRGSPRRTAQELKIKLDTFAKPSSRKTHHLPVRRTEQRARHPARKPATNPSESGRRCCRWSPACTRVVERVSAAIGLLPGGARTRYETGRDVTFGGVLCAPPARTKRSLPASRSLFRRWAVTTPRCSFSLLGFMCAESRRSSNCSIIRRELESLGLTACPRLMPGTNLHADCRRRLESGRTTLARLISRSDLAGALYVTVT